MSPQYEYEFVRLRLRKHWLFGVTHEMPSQYQEQIHQHAREGWRLVQIFSPPLGFYGTAVFFELVFEREVSA